ncbi:fungal-specific transcription factor domain-containing protein [Xylariaceae sp. FL0016]|nr:fungal-specific transcription factor domain-containing protein [Xylariaceae sp. FL0016]
MEYQVPRPGNAYRSSNGCWTCRLRRKKCDENHPVCATCAALLITCHYGQEKPEWMDGGVRQEEMALRLKGEVKEMASRRIRGTGERAFAHASSSDTLVGENAHEDANVLECVMKPCPEATTTGLERGNSCKLAAKDVLLKTPLGRSDTVLIMFYLEHFFPFQFPLYHPSLLQGGRSWILEMMLSSPVLREITLCQSSYFFSLVQEPSNGDVLWETVLGQTRSAFNVLRQSLQVITGLGIAGHLHGAVRTLASIMQIQRFEISVSSFSNCQAHLNAAVALFQQMMNSADTEQGFGGPSFQYNAIMSHIGPSSPAFLDLHGVQVPSAEQSAFAFSSALLIFDDIIAGALLGRQPKIYEYHACLLGGTDPCVNLEAVLGCQSWVIMQISEIAVLGSWKLACEEAGDLDMMELVGRATNIKNSLASCIAQLQSSSQSPRSQHTGRSNVFQSLSYHQSNLHTSQVPLVTQVWAHAALVYLYIIVSGKQPANSDVRYHVGEILEILARQIQPPALIRSMAWPLCIAGCLAESAREVEFRNFVEKLQPSNLFGTIRKAMEIMEIAWHRRDERAEGNCYLAACFQSQGDLVLLI